MLDVLLPHFIASSSCMASDSTAHSCSCRSNQHDRKDELAGFGTFNWMLEYLGLRRVGDVMTMTSDAPPVNRGYARYASYVRKQSSLLLAKHKRCCILKFNTCMTCPSLCALHVLEHIFAQQLPAWPTSSLTEAVDCVDL
jgi:hypothetical protein